MRVLLFTVMVAGVLSFSNSDAQIAKTTRTEDRPYATREGQRVLLHPESISFQIPKDWIEWFDKFHNNIHLTREELSAVKDGAGEWDTEYGKVVNSALPFDNCAAHVGGEGWGRDSVSGNDVQLRVYLTALRPQQVLTRIHGPALATARNVASFQNLVDKQIIGIEDGRGGGWQRVVIRYPVFYGDYGGLAQVRFFVRPRKGRTLVVVFMSGKREKEEIQEQIQKILSSFSLD